VALLQNCTFSKRDFQQDGILRGVHTDFPMKATCSSLREDKHIKKDEAKRKASDLM